ncbi:MAG: hypothetical protein HXK58_09630, partial [Campylobacter concisus]|nr:hypothetical protein [Campylobacter concisus]
SSNLKPFLFTARKSPILGTLKNLVLKSIISITKFSSHFLTIFAKLTLSHFCQKPKIDNDQRVNFLFFYSVYLAKIDAIRQKQRRPMHHKATKQAKSTPTTHQKKQKSTSNPHQNQAKSHKMGWVCSQKLTLSPHPDKPSHYLIWHY